TTDGGDTWKNVYLDSGYYHSQNDYKNIAEIRDIAYPSTDLFLAVDDSGMVLRTTDKGETWQKIIINNNVTLWNLRMFDKNIGIMMSGSLDSTKVSILKTIDGGLNWKRLNFPQIFDTSYFEETNMISENDYMSLIYIKGLGYNIMYVENDWDNYELYQLDDNVLHLQFLNDKKGWVCGGNRVNQENFTQLIKYSEDGGKSWTIQRDTLYNGYALNGISFYDDKFGIATSGFGCVVITTDGGRHWKDTLIYKRPDTSGDPYMITSPEIPTANIAYVIGSYDYIYKFIRSKDTTSVNTSPEAGFPVQSYPSPARAGEPLRIKLNLPEASEVKAQLFDALGAEVSPPVIKFIEPGGDLFFDIDEGLAAGVYFLRIEEMSNIQKVSNFRKVTLKVAVY
ncbi:MAG: hypothetical protein QG635_1845, partial [Bacteroidota bacterium]|nr:hypothetical protein [Bacteroidota bacterium]